MPKAKGFFKKDGVTHPITEKKSKSDYHGQTSDPNWKENSIKDLKSKKLKRHASKEELDFDTIMDNCDYDEESFGKIIREISGNLEPSSGISYGQGEFWYKYNEWQRKRDE